MKKIAQFLLFLCLFISLLGLVFIVIMTQNGFTGIIIALGINVLIMVLLTISIFGMITGKINFLYIKSRIGALGLLLFSVIFLLYISGLALVNLLLEKEISQSNLGFKEKTLVLANLFIPLGYEDNLLTEKVDGLTIKYPKGGEGSIPNLQSYYPQVKEEADQLFGRKFSDSFTIIIYENRKIPTFNSGFEKSVGFFQNNNQSIHILGPKLIQESEFEHTFYHEYAHYRTHQFLSKNNISINSIPAWFHEGIGEFFGYSDTNVDIVPDVLLDLKKLDSNADFQHARQGSYDPYLQSYIAVRELVLGHGTKVIPELLLAAKDHSFYAAFQKVTGKSFEEFQGSFMEEKKRVDSLIEQAAEAGKKGDFATAETIYLDILRIDPKNTFAADFLLHTYVKQGKFEEAIKTLEVDRKDYQLHLLSELYLLSNPHKSLIYAEEAEQLVAKNQSSGDYAAKYAEAVRKINSNDPIAGYELLFKEDFINYKEIQNELYKILAEKYPDDIRVQKLL